MNRTQKILGFALLVAMVAVMAYTLAEMTPNLLASIGWHDLASVGWVTSPM